MHAANLDLYQGKCMSLMDEKHFNKDGMDKFPEE